MKTYACTATREGTWWVVLATVGKRTIGTQVSRLDQVERGMREALGMALDVDPDDVALDVTIDLGDDLNAQIEESRRLAQVAAEAQARASTRTRETVRELSDRGFTVRDAGRLIGVSPQRVSQLLSD